MVIFYLTFLAVTRQAAVVNYWYLTCGRLCLITDMGNGGSYG